jgi:hypothetical protein
MTEQTQASLPQISPEEAQEIMRSLLHKEGNWTNWGKNCQILQKNGYNPQEIFEQTGFQSSQQNLIIVAFNVYESLIKENASEELLNYYIGPRSDVLYELRILNQKQRAQAAQVAYEKRLEVDEAYNLAKAVQEIARMAQLPAEFTRHPGDAMAYLAWKRAKNKRDLQERTRLIVQGLKYAHSPTAREAIEKLLSDFTVTPKVNAPLLPIYRLESEEELPRIVPLIGRFPIDKTTFEQTPKLENQEPFRVVKTSVNCSVVPIPGWQSVLKAGDPVAIFMESNQLPIPISGKTEEVLLLVDRSIKEWNINQYLLIEENERLQVKWFENKPDCLILGQIVLVLRPKKILDENNLLEPWQMDD